MQFDHLIKLVKDKDKYLVYFDNKFVTTAQKQAQYYYLKDSSLKFRTQAELKHFVLGLVLGI